MRVSRCRDKVKLVKASGRNFHDNLREKLQWGGLDDLQRARPYANRSFLIEATGEAVCFLENERGEVWAMSHGLRTLPRAVSQ